MGNYNSCTIAQVEKGTIFTQYRGNLKFPLESQKLNSSLNDRMSLFQIKASRQKGWEHMIFKLILSYATVRH